MKIVSGQKSLVKLAVVTLVCIAVGCLALVGYNNRASASSDGPPATFTDAPGETNCTVCHTQFPVNSGTGSVSISGIPHDYLPGQQVTITVKTSQADATVYGFEMTAVDAAGRRAGTFSVPPGSPPKIQVIDGIVNDQPREYVEQTLNGLFTNGVFGSNSWTFTWTAPARKVGKVGFYAAGNAANSDSTTNGDYIYTRATASLSGSGTSNFNGDFQSDIAVYRPSNGFWYAFNIADGTFTAFQFGIAEDTIVPGDYDGDGTTDYAVFRPSNSSWYIQRSLLGPTSLQFGTTGDIPVASDYDGDGKTDIGVFRPSAGFWYTQRSTQGFVASNWGLSGDKPMPGDYDADGKTDLAVFRPSDGFWYILPTTAPFSATKFGTNGDRPVAADYDGDGRTDIAVYRPSTGAWFMIRSSLGQFGIAFGAPGDIPAPADYDADGKTDVAVFRPATAAWYVNRSSDGSFYATTFGLNGDIPVASGYIPQ